MDILNTKIKSILTEKNTKILPGNIKSGVNILGVVGNVIALNGETKTITPTTSSQTILPSSGKNAITQVNVDAVTSAIDNNIQAGNIKSGVTILEVTGTYEGQQPTGTISITENGTVDVSQYASADVNVQGSSSDYNAKIKTTNTDGSLYVPYLIEEIPIIDLGNNVTSLNSAFAYFKNLKKFPAINTAKITNMSTMFRYCAALQDVEIFNTSRVTNMNNMYQGCTALSNESLNNILYMCANATAYTGTKTLAVIGLTSAQATTCQSLSNWDDFVSAGWTTGY